MASKTSLQEQILQLDGSIYYPEGHEKEGKELIKADLVDAIDQLRTAALDAHKAEQAEAEQARQPTEEESESPIDPPHPAEAEGLPEPAPEPVAAAPMVDPPKSSKKPGRGVTAKDRALAKKHGYPVAIPGGKAFTTSSSFNCAFGGGLRPMGSVVILTAAHAAHKADYLTPV